MDRIDRNRTFMTITVVLAVVIVLCLIFPSALAFVEVAALEVRYLWWLVLILAFGIWLAWGFSRKPK